MRRKGGILMNHRCLDSSNRMRTYLLSQCTPNNAWLCSKTNMNFSCPLALFCSSICADNRRTRNRSGGCWIPVVMIEMIDWYLSWVVQEQRSFPFNVGFWDVRQHWWNRNSIHCDIYWSNRYGSPPPFRGCHLIDIERIDTAVWKVNLFHFFSCDCLHLPQQLRCSLLIVVC